MQRGESQEVQREGTGSSTAAQAAAGHRHTHLPPSPGRPQGAWTCFGKHLLEQPWSLPRFLGMILFFPSTRSCSHQVWNKLSSRAYHCPCHHPPADTACVGFIDQLSQTSWIKQQRMRKEGEAVALHPTKGPKGQSRRGCGIPLLVEAKPLSHLVQEARKSKVRAEEQNARLWAVALACQQPKHCLPPDPTAKGPWYQRFSSSPEKSQGLGALCWRQARHRLAAAALVAHLHQPASREAKPQGDRPGPQLLRGLITAWLHCLA